MKNLNMFCVTMSPKHGNFIQKLGYVPVGLGDKDYSDNFLTDRKGINIAKKKSILWRIYISLLAMEK